MIDARSLKELCIIKVGKSLGSIARWKKKACRTAQDQRFLVICTTGIGDSLMITPAIANLRYKYPEALIHGLLTKKTELIFRNNPCLDRILMFRRGLRSLEVLFSIVSGGYDNVIVFHTSDRVIWLLALASGADSIVASDWQRGRLAERVTTNRVLHTSEQHRIEVYNSLAKVFGADDFCTQMKLFFRRREQRDARRYVSQFPIGAKKTVGIVPGGQNSSRRWPIERYIELTTKLVSEGFFIFILVGPGEEDLGQQILTQRIEQKQVVIINLEFRLFAAVVQTLDLVISNDTGSMHVALAVGTKTLGLFASADPLDTGPYKVSSARTINKPVTCFPSNQFIITERQCLNMNCANPICMEQIGCDEVFRLALEMITD